MSKNRIPLFFDGLTNGTTYRFLEQGKDDNELDAIAKEKDLQLPSNDIAIFKGRYALVDEENLNKCTLPRKEVEKALNTINGKALDKDHMRRSVIGHWLCGKIEGDEIICYGAFLKSNFPEEYEEVKDKMKKGEMKISFEAWGEKANVTDKGSYDLVNIEFAGGAFLFETDPACPKAEVLEFARVMTDEEKSKFINANKEMVKGTDKTVEKERILNKAKFSLFDADSIYRILYEVTECSSCKAEYPIFDILSINFEDSTLKVRACCCDSKQNISLRPTVEITKKGKNKASNEAEDKKEKKGGNTLMDEMLKKYAKTDVNELVTYLDATIDEIKASVVVKDEEIATLTTEKDELTKSLDEAKKTSEEATQKLNEKLEAEKAAEIAKRRDELGEEACKDVSDEDIMNEDKFSLLKANKKIAELEKSTEIKEPVKAGLEAGKVLTDEDPSIKKQKSIQSKAFGTEKE